MSNQASTPTQPPRGIPPVNHRSPLIAANAPQDATSSQGPSGSDATSFNFGHLRSALAPGDDSPDALRKVVSAPHSMHKMAGSPTSPKTRARLAGNGGPMRRVATATTSLTMRRSTSFMWTMDVHRDFESAVQTLVSRGRQVSELSAADVLALMKYSGAPGLTESSVERHLQVCANSVHLSVCLALWAQARPRPAALLNCHAPVHACVTHPHPTHTRVLQQKRTQLQLKLSQMLPPPAPVSAEPPKMERTRHAESGSFNNAGTSSAAPQANAPAGAPAPPSSVPAGQRQSLSEAMQRQQAMQRQMMEQQRVMQMQALEQPLATST
mmetsp:Transcript_4484/g.12577  ORF Transcript_4484/g.12577 Transcript_4484/m.12577 type:complete len:325 (+) Transcript_4484:332-1306(+)